MVKDKRKARRQPMRYTAWVALSAEQRHGCALSDVSDTGARIDVQDSTAIPDQFYADAVEQRRRAALSAAWSGASRIRSA